MVIINLKPNNLGNLKNKGYLKEIRIICLDR